MERGGGGEMKEQNERKNCWNAGGGSQRVSQSYIFIPLNGDGGYSGCVEVLRFFRDCAKSRFSKSRDIPKL